jgi:DNA ligase-1
MNRCGYGKFHDCVDIIKGNKNWSSAQLLVFDTYSTSDPFESRYHLLQTISNNKSIKVIEQIKCENKEHLQQFAASVSKRNGEGVMLRSPSSVDVLDLYQFKVLTRLQLNAKSN